MNNTRLFEYCQLYSTPLGKQFDALEKETHLKTICPQMLAGNYQGQLLRMISLMMRPKNILEIGTFTGYSTLCLAEGMMPGGVLTTIEINSEMKYFSEKYLENSRYSDQIDVRMGDAKRIIPTLDDSYDLVFLDARKEDYSLYFELIIEKINEGGLLIADNVLWGGKVLNKEKDVTTKAIDDFNRQVQSDKRVENIIIPIRDGITLIRKRAMG